MLPLLCLLFTMHLPPTDGWQTYKDSLNRYTITYPATWNKQYYQNAVAFLSPLDGSADLFAENVNVILQDLSKHPMSLKDYTELSENQYKTTYGDSSIVLVQDTTFEGNEAKKGIFIMADPKQPLKILQYWFIKKNVAYLLTYTAEPAQFDRFLPAVMKIVGSFKLLK